MEGTEETDLEKRKRHAEELYKALSRVMSVSRVSRDAAEKEITDARALLTVFSSDYPRPRCVYCGLQVRGDYGPGGAGLFCNWNCQSSFARQEALKQRGQS